RADEDRKIKSQSRHENIWPKDLLLIATVELFLQDVLLLLILVADINDSLFRAGDQPGDDHALDHQVRKVGHDEAVFDGAGFALVRIADDEFFIAIGVADRLPLHAGGESRTAHAAQSAFAQHADSFIPLRRTQQIL